MINKLRALNFSTDILPFTIATLGEFGALYFWLYFLDQDRFILANIILWTGFGVERVAVYLWIRFIYRTKEGITVPPSFLAVFFGLLFITLSEVLIWIVWLSFADGKIAWADHGFVNNTLLAGIALMLLMWIEHSVEMGALRQKNPLLYFKKTSTIFFTFMEVIGAVGWLYFVRTDSPILGGFCLLIGLSVEHILQGSDLRPEEPSTEKPAKKAI